MDDEEVLDEWTTGLQRRLPHIYERLERFLDECARAAGRERIAPIPEQKPQKKINPSKNEEWMNKLHTRRNKQKMETDARNLQILKDLVSGKKSAKAVIAEFDLSSEYSLYNTLKATHLRGGYGDGEKIYLEYVEMRKKGKFAEPEESKEVFDGYTINDIESLRYT